MGWFAGRQRGAPHRNRLGSGPRPVEVLESRALLADGITPTAAPALNAVAGVPLTNVVFATYTVSDPSGEPGDQWRAHINFGDGQGDGPVIPVQRGEQFEFVDTHTYKTPGKYSVSVMIAVPGSHTPNDNIVTTQVNVTAPTPTPTPLPPDSRFTAFGLRLRTRVDKALHGNVALFRDPNATTAGLQAFIDWGDRSPTTMGQIRARGKAWFAVGGSHRYASPGAYRVTVTIQDPADRVVATFSSVSVKK